MVSAFTGSLASPSTHSLYKSVFLLLHLFSITVTLSTSHRMESSQDKSIGPGAFKNIEEYLYVDPAIGQSSGRVWRHLKHYKLSSQYRRKKRESQSTCNDSSLTDILTSCQSSVMLTSAVMSDPSVNQTALLRTEFCGLGCRTKMFLHARECNLSSFIVEVAGDCTNTRDSTCIHAAVLMIDGILWCSIELDQGRVNSSINEAAPTAPSSGQRGDNSSSQCSLSTTYSTRVNHRFLFDKEIGQQVLSPPLEPPWQNCTVFASNNMSSSSNTDSMLSTTAPNSDHTPSSRTKAPQTLTTTTTASNSSLRLCSTHNAYLLSLVCVLWCLVLSRLHIIL